MTVNQRIKQLRQTLNLSQAKFARTLPISSGYMAEIELESKKANDRVVKLICSTFGASEVWLKTGEGEMFDKETDKKINKAVGLFKQLNPEFQDYVLKQIDNLLELQDGSAGKET